MFIVDNVYHRTFKHHENLWNIVCLDLISVVVCINKRDTSGIDIAFYENSLCFYSVGHVINLDVQVNGCIYQR